MMTLESLSNKIWQTKQARFEASRRMRRNHRYSFAAVSLLSVYIIALNLIVFTPIIKDEQSNIITVATIVLSVFALVLSLMVSILQYERREYTYHQCGESLRILNDQIQIRLNDNNIATSEIENFLEQYTRILEASNLNHARKDHMKANGYQALFTEEHSIYHFFSALVNNIRIWLNWMVFDSYIIYLLLILLPPLITFMLLT